MDFQYVACDDHGRVIKGRLSAATEEAGSEALTFAGMRVVSLKQHTPFINSERLSSLLATPVKPGEVILFYRQLAMLLESGTNIVTSLELLRDQATNRTLKNILSKAIADVRGGAQLSGALAKQPKVFSPVYARLLNVGEQGGNLETVLVQISDYMEREMATAKAIKGALMMPGITAVIAVVVVSLMVIFVLPAFGKLYGSMGATMPPAAAAMMSFSYWAQANWLVVLIGIAAAGAVGYLYCRTAKGRYVLDKVLLKMPVLGRIRLLSELSRICRAMALLFHSGLPLAEAMTQLIQGSTNRVLTQALYEIREEMLKGEGISKPMAKNRLFLPMMVQMVRVGEETGNLDVTLTSVAKTFETEAGDRMHSAVALIQPTMTIIIGLVVGIVAITLFSTIYGMTSSFG